MEPENQFDSSFDDNLENKAQKFNMTAIQVRSLLYNVLRDERVITLAQIKSRELDDQIELVSVLDVDMPSTRLRRRISENNSSEVLEMKQPGPLSEESANEVLQVARPDQLANDFRVPAQKTILEDKIVDLDDDQDDDYIYKSSEDDDDDTTHIEKLRISRKECLDLINSAEVNEELNIESYFKLNIGIKNAERPNIRRNFLFVSSEKRAVIRSLFQQHVVLLTILGILTSQHETLNESNESIVNLLEEINYFSNERKRILSDSSNDPFCNSRAIEALVVLQRWKVLNNKDTAPVIFNKNLSNLHSMCECHNGYESIGATFHYNELTKLPYPQLSLRTMSFFMLELFFVQYPLLLPKKGIDIRVSLTTEKLWKVKRRKRSYKKRKSKKDTSLDKFWFNDDIDTEDLQNPHANPEANDEFSQSVNFDQWNIKTGDGDVNFEDENINTVNEHQQDFKEGEGFTTETHQENKQDVDTYSVLLLKSVVPYSRSEDNLIILAYYQWKNRWIDAQINLLPTRNYTHIRTRFATYTKNILIPNGDIFSLPAPNIVISSDIDAENCLFYTKNFQTLENLPSWIVKLREIRVLNFVHLESHFDCLMWNKEESINEESNPNYLYGVFPISKMSGCVTILQKIPRKRFLKTKMFLLEPSNPIYALKPSDNDHILSYKLHELIEYVETQKDVVCMGLEAIHNEIKSSTYQNLIFDFVNSINDYLKMLPEEGDESQKSFTMLDKAKKSPEISRLIDMVLGNDCFTDKIKFWKIFEMERQNILELRKHFLNDQCAEIFKYILDSLTGDVLKLINNMESYKEVFCQINFRSDIFPSIFELVQSTLNPKNMQNYRYERISNVDTNKFLIEDEETKNIEENNSIKVEEIFSNHDAPTLEKYLKKKKKQFVANMNSLKLQKKTKSWGMPRKALRSRKIETILNAREKYMNDIKLEERENDFLDIYYKLKNEENQQDP